MVVDALPGQPSGTHRWLRVPGWRDAAWWAGSLFAGVALAGGLSVASWFAFAGGPTRAPQFVEIVIPAGAAERVAAGERPPSIPSNFTFVVGDTLVLRNEDSVQHQIGGYTVPAGGVIQAPLRQASSQSFLCTFHPAGQVGLTVKGRSNPWSLLWPTFLLGIPLGLAFGAVATVLRRIDWD